MVQTVEDVQGLLPSLRCDQRLPGSLVDVAEMGEDLGLFVTIAEGAGDAKGTAKVVGALGEVADLVLGVAEDVPAASFAGAVAEVAVHRQGLPAELPGHPVVAE